MPLVRMSEVEQTVNKTASGDWWRGCVIYQVYPRSYQDTSGDGIGDIAGIIRRLDHIASLGVDAIWRTSAMTCRIIAMSIRCSAHFPTLMN